MTNIYVKATISGGCTIDDACRAAINLADRLNSGVEFTFNGERLVVRPADYAEAHVADFMRRIAPVKKKRKVVKKP